MTNDTQRVDQPRRTHLRTKMSLILLVGLLAGAAAAAEPAKPGPVANADLARPDLDKLVGQPVDLAPWAYAWRADRNVQPQAEACFIPRRLKRMEEVYRPPYAAECVRCASQQRA